MFSILLIVFISMGTYYMWNTNSRLRDLTTEKSDTFSDGNSVVIDNAEIKHYTGVEWTERKSTFGFLDNGVVTPVEGTRISAEITENITENVRSFMDHYKSQMENQDWEYLEGRSETTSENYSYKKGDKYLSYGYVNVYDDISDRTSLSGFVIYVTYN